MFLEGLLKKWKYVIAALIAEKTTTLSNLHYLDRGYEAIETKLAILGADITRTKKEPLKELTEVTSFI